MDAAATETKTSAETWQAHADASAAVRRVVRSAAGVRYGYPVRVTEGDAAPAAEGEAGHWTTPGGRPVYHPNAYRAAWGKPVYHCSTIEIRVGAGWLDRFAPLPTDAETAAVCGPRATRRAMDAFAAAEHGEWYARDDRLRRAAERANPYMAQATPAASQRDWQRAKAGVARACDPKCSPRTGVVEDEPAFAAAALEFASITRQWAAHREGQPTDDQRRIERPYLVAQSEDGLLIADDRRDPRVVQVIVRDATTGHRHAITVPPHFGRVGCGFFRDLHTDARRVWAAIAWTFGLTAGDYRPGVEA